MVINCAIKIIKELIKNNKSSYIKKRDDKILFWNFHESQCSSLFDITLKYSDKLFILSQTFIQKLKL